MIWDSSVCAANCDALSGLDHNVDEVEEELRLSAEARARASETSHSGETNGKYVVDIFGQTHPAISNEIFECMNCGRSIVAGRFAPHMEKCMGKGRKVRLKATRITAAAQNRYSRGTPLLTQQPYWHPHPTGDSAIVGNDYSNGTMEES